MIKIIQAFYVQKKILRLYFSDNSYGDYDLQPLIDKEAELVLPLKDEIFSKIFFGDGGIMLEKWFGIMPRQYLSKII